MLDRGQRATAKMLPQNVESPHTNTVYSAFYRNINTPGCRVQTSRSVRLNEHLSSVTSHSEAFRVPLVLIKTTTSFSTQLWPNLAALPLAGNRLRFTVASEDTMLEKRLGVLAFLFSVLSNACRVCLSPPSSPFDVGRPPRTDTGFSPSPSSIRWQSAPATWL